MKHGVEKNSNRLFNPDRKGCSMKIIIAPDSFKGSLSAKQPTLAMENGIRKAIRDGDLEIIRVFVADGGEGTVEAFIEAAGGNIIADNVADFI